MAEDVLDDFDELRAEIRHLRAGISAYRAALTLSGGRAAYSIVDSGNLRYVRAWEEIDQARKTVR